MANTSLPHFGNIGGDKEIFIGVKKFMCAGAAAPFDHPHIFLTMGQKDEKLCPYCSALYRFDAGLQGDKAKPARH